MSGESSRGRLASLDVLRGLTVMGMILVNATAGMFYDAKAQVYLTLLHSHWNGLTLADVVFPAFLMMVGVSIPIARSADSRGLDRTTAWRIGGRMLRLIVIGFLLSNLYWFAKFHSSEWRLWGVLQRIGLVYGVCALLSARCGWRMRAAIIVAILVLYWPLALLPSPDGLPTDILTRGHNFIAWADRAMLGAGGHIYVRGAEGYDPEGLLGTLPAIAHGLIGVAVGEYLQARRGRGGAGLLAAAGAAMLAGGLVLSLGFPIIKDIWSSSFVLVTCGITTMALALLYAWMDGGSSRALPWAATIPLAFGVNAIAAYVLHEVSAQMVAWDLLLAPYRATLGTLPPGAAALIPVALYMALIWLAMAWLQHKNWIIKV